MVVRSSNSDEFTIDEALMQRLRELARLRGEDAQSALRFAIQQAERVQREAGSAPASSAAAPTPYEIALREGLIGCIDDTPPDLSTNPAYMEGFGESRGRD